MGETLVDDSLQSCPYIPGNVARLPLFRQDGLLDLDETDRRFEVGERRVGRSLYRTACPTCDACKVLRVDVPAFAPTASQRRVLRRWEEHGRVELGPPSCDDVRLDLYHRHKTARGLAVANEEPMNALTYSGWLIQSCFFSMEMRYFWKDRLVGVGIVDLGRSSASSVYFYFDPDEEISRLSPGVFSVIQEVEFCRRTARRWLYLGLWVERCTHLSYKADYFPHERKERTGWVRVEGRSK